MPFDIRFSISNTPGATVKAARALGDAGINIVGVGADIRPGDAWGFMHFCVEEAEDAVRALSGCGIEVQDIHDVDVVGSEGADRPGALADICETYAEKGENIEVLYLATDSRVVVGTERMRRPFTGRNIADTHYSDTRLPGMET